MTYARRVVKVKGHTMGQDSAIVAHMPWGEEVPSGKWRACWRNLDGQKRYDMGEYGQGYRDEATAKRVAGQKERDVRRGLDEEEGGRTLTWGEWRKTWEKLRRLEPQTRRQDRYRLNRYVEPQWGPKKLTRIKREHVQEWVNDLARTESARGDTLAATTVTRIYHLLSASMKSAADHGRIAISPCRNIKLPVAGPGAEYYMTRAEVDAVVHHMHDSTSRANARMYRCLVVVGTETGLRFGELAGLHWWRIDLDQGLLNVAETWDPVDRKIKAYPKGRLQRAVPISDRCLEALSAMLKHRPDGNTCGLTHAAGRRCRSPLVFMTARGVPLDAHNFGRRQWATACKAAGVEGATPHDMRHTYASWLRQAGVDLEQVQKLLGHASIVTTQRYSHIGDTQHAAVLKALNS